MDPSKLDTEIQEKESQLTALKAEIKSRQRLLAQMADQKSDPALADKVKRLENEIFVRDRQIEALNERVISLDSKLRERPGDDSKGKDELILKLQSEISTLEKFRQESDFALQALQTELSTSSKKLNEEVENYRLLHEGEVQDHDNTRTKLDMKDRQLSEGRADMVRLAKTIEDLTRINTDLGEKIGKLNQDLEDSRAQAFKVNSRAQYADELEKSQESFESRLKSLSDQLQDATKSNELLTSEKISLERCISDQEFQVASTIQSLTRLIARCATLESKESQYKDEVETLRKDLQGTIGELEEVRRMLREKQSSGLAEVADAQLENRKLRDTVREVEAANKAKDRDYLKLSSDINSLNSRLLDREQLISSLRKSVTDSQEAAKRQSSAFEGEIAALRQRTDSLLKEISEKDMALSKALTESALVQTRYEETKIKLETAVETSSASEVQIRELKSKVTSLQRERTETEKTVQSKESQLTHAVHKIKALEEELWNRDSDGMKKDSQIVKVTQQCEEAKKSLAQLSAKMRSTIAEKLSEANKLIEAKETEVVLLTEMLRSCQLQLKQKESELSHSKKRPGEAKGKEIDVRSSSKTTLAENAQSKETEIIARIRKFCGDSEHLLRFCTQKRKKIEALRNSQQMSPQWLQEELKLPYLPEEDIDPVEVLTESVNQRIEFLRGTLVSELAGDWGVRVSTEELLQAVESEQLAELLDGYEDVSVKELLEKLRGLNAF